MVSFGRPPSKRVGIPNNRSMTVRANAQLEAIAVSKATQFTTALGVDAPIFYFWHKDNGSIPCSCISTNYGPNVDIDIGGETKTTATAKSDVAKPAFKFVETNYGEQTLEDLFGKPSAVKPATLKEKLTTNVYDDPSESFDDLSDDIDDIEAMPTQGITDFDDPLNLFSDKTIACPICLGSGYIDAWNTHGGKRFVFDTSNAYDFYCEGVDINAQQNPTQMTAQKNGKVFWNFTLPMIWDKILRINVFNGTQRLEPWQYSWIWIDGATSDVMTPKSLNTLNGTAKNIKLSIQFTEDNTEFTHAEIIFSFTDPYRAQIPEVEQGYEQEFLDWSINLAVELPPELKISEGDYLTESKYRKVWKVATLTKKVTAGGVVFGLSANLRALHTFEKNFVQLSLFTTNYLISNLVK